MKMKIPNIADQPETGVDDWADKWGACKICQGEIPYGHAKSCVILQMQTRRRELEQEGVCRFNCRTRRAMFLIGYNSAISNQDFGGDFSLTAEEAFDEWMKENENG